MDGFAEPKVELEQYPTGAHLASRMLHMIHTDFDDLEGKLVVDLGTGCGALAIGAAVLGAEVVGLDIDADALEVARANLGEFEELYADFVQQDVRRAADSGLKADTVLMNPPFGTRRKGADMDFLRVAATISAGAIYSLNKSSTRQHIHKVATEELGMEEADVLAQLRYDLPKSYRFHKLKTKDIEVDLWRFRVSRGSLAKALAALAVGDGT